MNIIAENSKTSYNYITFESFKKGYFFNLKAEKLMIFYTPLEQPILTISDFNASLDILSLLLFNPMVHFASVSNNGSINGSFKITDDRAFEINIKDFHIENQKGLMQLKIDGKGIVNIDISGRLQSGEYKITVNQLNIKPIHISGVLVPFDKFDSIKGIGNFKDKVLYVKSLAFSGNGIHALAKGSISKNKSDILIEIITTREMSGYRLIDIALNKFKKSEGFYVIPFETGLIF